VYGMKTEGCVDGTGKLGATEGCVNYIGNKGKQRGV
jgi:hypothetical protein